MNQPEQPEAGRPGKRWWLQGKTPDYRFTLANERTFLAWIRTALALMAGAVAIEQFPPARSSVSLRLTISLLLLTMAFSLGLIAWRRWRQNEYAMRLEKRLPYTRMLAVLSGFSVLLAILLAFLLFKGQA